MRVQVTSQLKAQLASVDSTAESILVSQFKAWKSLGEDEYHLWFAKDVLGDDGNLYHVHLIPNNEQEARAKWERFFYGP